MDRRITRAHRSSPITNKKGKGPQNVSNSGAILWTFDAKAKARGSKYSYMTYFGLKVPPIWVLWGLSISYMGTWTLWVKASPSNVPLVPELLAERLEYNKNAASYASTDLQGRLELGFRVWGPRFVLWVGGSRSSRVCPYTCL